MDRKNLIIIAILVLAVALIGGASWLLTRPRTPAPATGPAVTSPDGAVTPVVAGESPAPETGLVVTSPDGAVTPIVPGESPAPTKQPVRAWMVVTVDRKSTVYPLTKTGDYTIEQKKKHATNVIHVTPDSITMASSTCDNQLCVSEGTVTLDNKADRILGNYIICLPNSVQLELLNEAEYAERYPDKQ